MKKIVYLCILIICITGSFYTGEMKASENLYPISTEVVGIDATTDTVIVQQPNGNIWEFTGVDDWEVGDTCNMIMNDNGTDNIYDDIIVKTQYSL